MSMLQLIVNESTRKLSNRSSNQVFVVNDANVDTIRFSIPAGFSDITIDDHTSFRVMYIPPGIDKTVYAKTLTFVQNDGVYISYDWQVGPNVLVESGILTVSFCILKIEPGRQEWHTIPYQIPVSNTIHTDDSDDADETITPTVAQRVAVLESMIQRVASGAPIVVSSTSAMTDTSQIYVLSTDGNWYYYDGSAWTAGGEYGGVAAGSITTDKLANGAVTTAKLANGAVTWQKLASGAVHTGELADSAVTNVKLADRAVTAEKIASGVIPVIDATLTQTGAAADAKAVGNRLASVIGDIQDELSAINESLDQCVLDRYDFAYPTNWYNPAEVESGRVYKNGTVETSSTMSHTGYIPVEVGDKVQLYRTGPITAAYRRNVCCYDANKVVVPNTGSDNWNDAAYTVPSGVKYVIYTFDNALISQTFNLIIVRDGIKPTSYTHYFDPYAEISDDFITPETEGIINKVRNSELSTTNLINRYGCALPPTTLKQTVGLSEVWYFANMGTPKGCEYGVTSTGNPLKRLNKGVEFGNTTAFTSSYGFYYNMYDILLNVIRQDKASGQGYPRRIVAENLSNCTVLAIGDSTIDSDFLTGRMLSYFSDKGKTLTLLGTLGDGSETNRNEGRSGWKASDYFTDKKYDGVTNPFYNPTLQTFDFAYYMTNQGYTAPDFVILQLGINDLYNSYSTDGIIESTYGYIKGIIDSILAYDGNIKVLINLPTPPNSDKSRHKNTEFLYWNTIIRYNDYALAQIKATYEESKVRCTYCHLILDPDTDIADTVHPTQDGYGKMAMEVINQINCWQNWA